MPNTSKLNSADYARAAQRLGWDIPTVKAVLLVESSGAGFLADGRVKVNYEPHVMYKRLAANFNQARADAELQKHPDLVAKSAGHLLGPNAEDAALEKATNLIDRTSALESASWGAPQIMGYHWKSLGFDRIQSFINLMYDGEAGQLEVFIRFILNDDRLVLAGRRHDWATFARIYNGPAYATHGYDRKLKEAYDRNNV